MLHQQMEMTALNLGASTTGSRQYCESIIVFDFHTYQQKTAHRTVYSKCALPSDALHQQHAFHTTSHQCKIYRRPTEKYNPTDSTRR